MEKLKTTKAPHQISQAQLQCNLYVEPFTILKLIAAEHQISSTHDSEKATELDDVCVKIMKTACPAIDSHIARMCNHNIDSNIFPVHRKESRENVENYGPASVHPVLSTILQWHIHYSLTHFLDRHHLLSRCHSGCWKNHHC